MPNQTPQAANSMQAGIQSILKANNYTPPTQPGTAPASRWQDLLKATPAAPSALVTSTTPIVSNPVADIKKTGATVFADIAEENKGNGVGNQGDLQKGIRAASDAAAAVPSAIADVIPGGKSVLGALGKGLTVATDTAGNIGNILADLTQKIGLMSPEQRAKYDRTNADFANSHTGQNVTNVADVLNNLGNIANLILGAQGGVEGANASPEVLGKVKEALTPEPPPPGSPPPEPPKTFKQTVAQTIYGKDQAKITQSLADSYSKIPLPKGVLQAEAATGKSFSDFMASKPYLSTPVDAAGKFDTYATAQKLREEAVPEAQALSSLLEHSPETIRESSIVDEMKKAVEHIATGQERRGVQEFIEREVPTLVDQFSKDAPEIGGDRAVPVADWNKIKQTLWDRSPFKATASRADNLKSSVDYAMGKVIRKNIEDTVDNADIRKLNSEVGDYYHTIETLENLHGGPAPKGRLGVDFARIAGTIAGSPGGIIGSVAGYMAAEKVAQFLMNPEMTTALKRSALEQLKTARPTVASQVAEILKKQMAEQDSRLRLPEAATRMGGTDSLGRHINASGDVDAIPQQGMKPSAHYMNPEQNKGLALPAGNTAIRLPAGKGITTSADQAVFERNAAGIKTESPQQQLRFYLDILGKD